MFTILTQTIHRVGQWRWPAICMLLCLLTTARAQGTFNSGSTGADGAFNPTQSQEVQLPESGVFNFTTVNIPAGVTIRFKRNSRNTPVTILASGNVTILGTIDVSGGSGNSSTIPYGVGGLGGPGGFDGGRGGTIFDSFPAGLSGNGPGGGGGARGSDSSSNLTGGSGSYAVSGSNGTATNGGRAGRPYGTRTILPLLGGSGGGGSFYGGGGGGGAILIASSGSITFGPGNSLGTILAKGGNGTATSSSLTISSLVPSSHCQAGGAGSGGAIRLIANNIAGNAVLNVSGGVGISSSDCGVGGYGWVRVETFSIANLSVDSSSKSISYGLPGLVTLANTPTLRITSIGGINAPATPVGSLHTNPDITLPGTQTNPVTIALQAVNIPLSTTVEVRVVLSAEAPASVSTSVQSTPLTGTVAASTATASLTLPPGQSLLYATASIDLTTSTAQLNPIFIEGERVRRIEVGASFGGASEAVYVTESGRRVKVE